MIKKLALTVVLLGAALLTLTGCFTKSSRRFIEGKAAELSKVYPTEDLEDLFEKFPGGSRLPQRIYTNMKKVDTNSNQSVYTEILKLDRFQVQYQRNKLVLIKMRSVVKVLYIRVRSFIKMVKFN